MDVPILPEISCFGVACNPGSLMILRIAMILWVNLSCFRREALFFPGFYSLNGSWNMLKYFISFPLEEIVFFRAVLDS